MNRAVIKQIASARLGLLIVLAALTWSATGTALEITTPGDRTITVRGYYKNFLLGLDSSIPLISGGISDLNRARLMLDSRVSQNWEVALHYEMIAEVNPLLSGGLFFSARQRPGLTSLSWPILDNNNVAWRHEIDRLQVRGRLDWGDVTIGRQAIGWGVGILWAPLDLMLAFSPVQIDREYRLGVDAGRVLIPVGDSSEVEGVYAFYGTDFAQQIAAFRWHSTLLASGIDIGMIAGKFFEDAVVGALVSGEFRGVGIHSSVNLTHHYGNETGPRDFARIVVGADYRFANNVIAIVEYYFNGWGASSPSSYLSRATADRVQRGEIFNLGRHYFGFSADWEVHPLVHLLARGQSNLADPSAQIGPAITLSLSDESLLEAGAFFGLGGGLDGLTPKSEFGLAPNLFYTAAKIYF